MAFRYVGAANLDFKQGGIFLQHYLNDHPNTRYAPVEPQSGIFVISVSDYLDIWNRHQYDWLLRYKPEAQVAYTYLVFKIDRLDPNGNQLP
jgi:hypothetical protein